MPSLRNACLGGAMIVLLAACVNRSEPAASAHSSIAPGADAVADTPMRVGSPYSIGGNSYTPVDQIDYDEVGYASWYGAELEGRPTANGEPFRSAWVSAAHRILPLPSYVEVTRLDTGRTILVRINDRGPADSRRLIDLSSAAAQQLGISEQGMAQVRVRRVNPSESERMTLRSGQVASLRLETPESLLEILRERAARLPRPATYVTPRAAPSPAAPAAGAPVGAGGFVVQIAAFSSRKRAETLARRLGAQVVPSGSVFRVRYGPFATEAEAQTAVAHARELGQPGAVIQHAP
ncbi:MAG: septal ring lytic transglycosylase RlpA family protein [Sphingopyxis sp.]